uniref:Candidate secreted effector n=1 Tax=Meloidogyne incognita TaxID=6306 RepID=A0A914N633_MELIC
MILLNLIFYVRYFSSTNGVPSYSNGPDCVQISNGGNSQGESIFPQNVGNKKSQQNGCSSACVGSMCVKTCN